MANPVSVTFLGGLGEIGRNCAAIEIDGRIMLLDCGLMFPEADMLGVDLVLPDFSWLIERGDDIVGCRFTFWIPLIPLTSAAASATDTIAAETAGSS